MCLKVLQSSLKKVVQSDGRLFFLARLPTLSAAKTRVFALWVTLADGENRPQRLLRPRLQGAGQVKLHYYPETDQPLYRADVQARCRNARDRDWDWLRILTPKAPLFGFDIDGASHKLDLATLETVWLWPLTAMKVRLKEIRLKLCVCRFANRGRHEAHSEIFVCRRPFWRLSRALPPQAQGQDRKT